MTLNLTIRHLFSIVPIILCLAVGDAASVLDHSEMQLILYSDDEVIFANWVGHDIEEKQKLQLANIRSITAADQVIAALTPRGVFLINPNSGQEKPILQPNDKYSLESIAIAPGKQFIAFLSRSTKESHLKLSLPPGTAFDLFLFEVSTSEVRQLVHGRASRTLSWRPDGEQIAYESWNGWVESVAVKDGRVYQLFKGVAPAWSPDGRKVAYRTGKEAGKEVFLYDPVSQNSEKIHQRYFWQRSIVGDLYWSPDGRFLSFNVYAELGPGYGWNGCVVLDIDARRTFSISNAGYACGPWFKT